MNDALLTLEGVHTHIGAYHILHGVDLVVPKGQLTMLLGRNGAGKTTTLRAVVGLLAKRQGSIEINGQQTTSMLPEAIAKLGVAYCPEERGIFSSLSTEENLLLPPVLRPGGLTVDEIYTLFPNLKERRSSQGTKLSGGEQQMLAIARILRTGADFLLLDECTEGLAPVIVSKIGQTIRILKERGFTVLMVEQNFRFASKVADRFYVIEEGAVVDHFRREDIAGDLARIESLLGL
jgi:branched-chain amino acid transport system ATP-binding protein